MGSTTWTQRRRLQLVWEIFLCMAGRLLFAISVNTLITPLNLYSVGFTGIAQLIRTFCIVSLHIQLPPGLDLTGIIFCLLNIPVLFLAWFGIGKPFFFKTLFITIVSSFFMTVVPVPKAPVLDDVLTMCIVGGVLAGVGAGIALKAGGSGGGQDVLGVYLSKKNPNMSVGIVSIGVSMLVYLACFIYFDVNVLIYSFIYSTITSLAVDKVHYQNIKMRVEIETARQDLRDTLAGRLNRHVLEAAEVGENGRPYHRLTLVITKAEQKQMLKFVRMMDADAFVILNEHIRVDGRFTKPIE